MTPKHVVLDASVAVRFLIGRPDSETAKALFSAIGHGTVVAHIPTLFFEECANALWKQVCFSSLTVGDAEASLRHLISLDLQWHDPEEYAVEALLIAVKR